MNAAPASKCPGGKIHRVRMAPASSISTRKMACTFRLRRALERRFTHLMGPSVLLETTPAGAIQSRNTRFPGQYGGLVSQNRSGTTSFYGFDSQQCTRILVSIGGALTDGYSYKAFGEELQSGSGTVNPFRFVGNQGYYRDLPGIMNVGWRRLIAASGT